jgi:uncharacterized protein
VNPIEPYYFGEEPKKLFGIYYCPIKETTNQIGVIFLNPIGREYVKIQRGLSYLAKSLSSNGFHVLRFDYYGTGDSAGHTYESNLNCWLDNINDAIKEMKAGIGLDTLILIGWNLGASLAVIGSNIFEVDGLILINPVISGEKYIKSILKTHNDWINGSFTKKKKGNKDEFEYLGFIYSNDFINEISKIDLEKIIIKQNVLVLNEPQQDKPELECYQKSNMDNSLIIFTEFTKDTNVWKFQEDEKLPFETFDLVENWIHKVYGLKNVR